MQEILERAFDFAGRAFGDGQESAMFVERLSMDERILKFIQKNIEFSKSMESSNKSKSIKLVFFSEKKIQFFF